MFLNIYFAIHLHVIYNIIEVIDYLNVNENKINFGLILLFTFNSYHNFKQAFYVRTNEFCKEVFTSCFAFVSTCF